METGEPDLPPRAKGAPKSDDFISSFSAEESLAEFRELATSAGATVVGEIIQKRDKADPATLVGKGKLEEIAGAAASTDADVVLFDHDLTPSQQRNIERELKLRVIDRTQLILDIFAKHARTREGQLQVELAQLEYMLPRLAGRGVEMSQLGGGIGTRGPGETQLETDRRKIYRRIRHIKEQVEEVRRIRAQQRQRREAVPVATVALVGYTNAGKSSLMRALTSSDVLVADKLFATLDTTVRRLVPPTEPPILVTDTVGFIKKLPHDLVASFRSTLDEAADADLLLHVLDASDPALADQLAVTREVLGEIGAERVDNWLLLNKIDRCDSLMQRHLADRYPGAIQLSARRPEDVAALRDQLIERFIGKLEEVELDIPWTHQRVIHMIHERTTVLAESHHDDGTRIKLRAPSGVVEELREALRADAR